MIRDFTFSMKADVQKGQSYFSFEKIYEKKEKCMWLLVDFSLRDSWKDLENLFLEKYFTYNHNDNWCVYCVENAYKWIYTIKKQVHEWTKDMNRQFTKEEIIVSK